MDTRSSKIRDDLLPTGPSRRALLLGAGAAAILNPRAYAQNSAPKIDHTIRIEPVALEIAPGKVIKTTGYNGTVPGPDRPRLSAAHPTNKNFS
jgi:hypothetical protein